MVVKVLPQIQRTQFERHCNISLDAEPIYQVSLPRSKWNKNGERLPLVNFL